MGETRQGPYRSKGFQQLASLAAATSLTVPNGARLAYLSAEAQDVRLRGDGTDPTAAIGLLVKAGSQPFLYQGDINTLKAIEAAASAKLNVEYLA